MSALETTDRVTSARSLMPPHVVLRRFLDDADVAGLLSYALSRQADFEPTRVGSKAVNPSIRVSAGLRELGPYRKILKEKILATVPELIARLQVTPFVSPRLETELVAHGDGAFYKRHIDTQTARYEDVDEIRVLSGVYYFFSEPKAFSGGALRLYAIGGDGDQNFIDIEPQRNSLLVFPSWAPHEVLPVHCPSGRFADSRFAVNCWLHRRKPAAHILPGAAPRSGGGGAPQRESFTENAMTQRKSFDQTAITQRKSFDETATSQRSSFSENGCPSASH